jgi:hypothetical protein
MFNITKVDHFPEITRQGRASEELQAIIQALHDSASKGERYCIEGIEPGNAYNSMQQRIRAQAKKLGYKVIIRFDRDSGALYFKANRAGNEKVPTKPIEAVEESGVQASEVGVKTAGKRTAKSS